MKNTILSILTALLLVLSAPLLAQSEEPPLEPQAQETEETAEPVVTEEAQATAESDAMYSDQEEATGEFEAEATATAEVQTDDEFDADIAADSEYDEEGLPRTASPLALLALLGVTAAGSALGLRSARRRR